MLRALKAPISVSKFKVPETESVLETERKSRRLEIENDVRNPQRTSKNLANRIVSKRHGGAYAALAVRQGRRQHQRHRVGQFMRLIPLRKHSFADETTARRVVGGVAQSRTARRARLHDY